MPRTGVPSPHNLLTVEGLHVGRPGATSVDLLVRDISFSLGRGDRVGLVGESGCGKSLTALGILDLLPAGLVRTVGRVELLRRDGAGPGRAAIVTQDPMAALNPCFRIGRQLANVLRANTELRSRADLGRRARELLDQVGMPNPQRVLDAFPHALSGGMRQRVVIALALAAAPDVLIADEPTTALDVTIQAQIIELLDRLCSEVGLALVLITHDMGVVASLCESVVVMYGGQVVEQSSTTRIFERPIHPYTTGLLSSVPQLDTPRDRALATIAGQVPSAWTELLGCRFAPRCVEATDQCTQSVPELERHGEAVARCFARPGDRVETTGELVPR